jgi:DHA2 family multidrug resistance protein
MIDRLALHWMRLVENLTPGNPNLQAFLSNTGAGLSIDLGEAGDAAATKLLATMVRRQADVLTFSDVLLLMAVVFIASLRAHPAAAQAAPGAERGRGALGTTASPPPDLSGLATAGGDGRSRW